MEYPITASLIGLVGVLVGVLIGHRLAVGRENRMRRANFVSRMCELKSLANKIEDPNFAEWFAKTQVAIEKQCGLVQGAICLCRRKKFVAVREKCSNAQRQDIADFDNAKLTFPRAAMTYQSGRILISELLKELSDYAS